MRLQPHQRRARLRQQLADGADPAWDWKFDGYVVSDCDAVTDIHAQHRYAVDAPAGAAAALKAGMDNGCNGATLSNTPGLGERYKQALARGYISQATSTPRWCACFSARFRNGDLPGLMPQERSFPAADAINAARTASSRCAPRLSLVLLKNDGALPLKAGTRIAVVGPLADARRVMRGNYSSAGTGPTATIAEALRAQFSAAQVNLVPFGPSITDGDPVPASAFLTPDGKPGLQASYFNLEAGSPTQLGKRRYQAKAFGSHTVTHLQSLARDFAPGRHARGWSGRAPSSPQRPAATAWASPASRAS